MTVPAKAPVVAVGEDWAYREKARERAVRVRVTRIGTTRPIRVRVRFVDDAFEGREDWVPPTRLKVPWSEVERWQAREDKWDSVCDACDVYDTPIYWAAEHVFDAMPDIGVQLGYQRGDAGVLSVIDLDLLCSTYGIETSLVTDHPLSFVDDDGTQVAPWELTVTVAQHVAPQLADVILTEVAKSEAKHLHRAMYGEHYTRFDGGSGYFSPEDCIEMDARWQPSYDIARQWCGVDAVERRDELEALRGEVLRLGRIAEEAISQLEKAGAKREAEALMRELGVPVETLRASRNYQRR
jgi:hypothetical protein